MDAHLHETESSPNSPPSSLTPETAKQLGIALTTKHADESIDQRIHNALGKIIGLEELLATTFPHFQIIMLHVLKNKIVDLEENTKRLRKTITKMKSRFLGFDNNKVDIEPAQNDEISASDAIRIGKKFALLLLTTTEPSAAVDSWLKDNKELKHFVADNIWFEPMMNAIAKKLLKSSNLGLKWRVVLGAIFSIG